MSFQSRFSVGDIVKIPACGNVTAVINEIDGFTFVIDRRVYKGGDTVGTFRVQWHEIRDVSAEERIFHFFNDMDIDTVVRFVNEAFDMGDWVYWQWPCNDDGTPIVEKNFSEVPFKFYKDHFGFDFWKYINIVFSEIASKSGIKYVSNWAE